MTKSVNTGILYLLIISGLFISACNKDDVTTEDLLAGKWNSGTITFDARIGDMNLSEYLISTGTSPAETILYNALMNSMIQSYFTGTLQINTDKTFSWTMTGTGMSATGTWSINDDGKELTLNSATAMTGIFEILELTATNLKVHMLQTIDHSLTGGFIPRDITVDVVMTFTR